MFGNAAASRALDELLFRTAQTPFTPTRVRRGAREAWAAAVGAFLPSQPLDLELIGLHDADTPPYR
jgi:hypothetical protein